MKRPIGSMVHDEAAPGASGNSHWYEVITESPVFKKLDDPRTKFGHILTTCVALVFAVLAFVQNPNTTNSCATNPLREVYNPKRLQVLATCQTVDGTVERVSNERDGDTHIWFKTDRKWLAAGNARQGGNLVVEYMPGDSYPTPRKGDRLRLVGTWVKDLQHGGEQHGWNELHPVFKVTPLGAAAQQVTP